MVFTALLLAGAAWWWRSHGAPAGAPARSEPEADEQARARLDRLRAQLAAASSAPLPSPRGDLEISGRVLGRSGPVAGAMVTATAPDPDEALPDLPCDPRSSSSEKLLDLHCKEAARLASLVAERRGDAQPMARATTDADGRFTLRGLMAGTYALWAEAAEGAGLNKGVAAGGSGDVLLGEGMRIRGKVVDGQGRPVEAAVVTAIFPDPSRFFDTLSAADGSFVLVHLPRSRYVVIAQSGTLLPDRARQQEGVDESLRLTLHAPRWLRGRVLKDGAPVPSASVTLFRGQHKLTTVTDQAGAFELGPLEAGEGLLTATQGNLRAETQVLIPERVDPPGVVLHLEPGGRLECSMRSAAGGPIPGAKVSLYGEGEGSREVPVAADGSCRMEGLRSGGYNLHATAKGFRNPDVSLVHIHSGETAKVQLVLEPVESFEGTVLDPDGRPLAGATVCTLHPYSDGEPTGDDGRFSLEKPQDGPVTLKASHDDYATTVISVTLPAPQLVVRLARGFDLDGVVLDAAGAPVQGALVEACDGRFDSPNLELLGCDDMRSSTTDAAGAFHLRALSKGPLTLLAIRDRGGLPGQQVLKVLERATADRVTLQFSPAGRIAGIAVDELGHPLQGVQVMMRAAQPGDDVRPNMGMVDSDEAGAFECPSLDVGEYEISGSLAGYQGAETRAHTGAEAVKLVLRPEPKVRGRVVTSDGEPVTVFRVNERLFDEPSGQFAVDRNVEAEMFVKVEAGDELATTIRRVPPGAGDHALGDVVMNAGRRIVGHVLDAETGLGIPGAMVAAGKDPGRRFFDPDRQSGQVATRPDGSFELPHVDDGAEVLIAWRDGYEQALLRMRGETELQVRLIRTGRIVGEVQWGGRQILGVVAEGVGRSARGSAAVDASGHFVIDDLPAGQYSVTAFPRPERATFFPVKVQVPPSGEVHVIISAQAAGSMLRIRVHGGGPEELPVAFLVQSLERLPSNREELVEALGSAAEAMEDHGEQIFRQVPAGEYVAMVALVNRKSPVVRLAMMPVVLGAQDQAIEIAVPTGAPVIDIRDL
ncbi:MAG TPA: carboxypeptidase-like regulatory domain-containing protein [Myxococcaceae bacterium]